eukprot:TRINITY_DN8391_c0_g1_i1.p1 TRINITY_DN8391_c0_g1~~TRINITY_DN8391_c0_g1_i1.p1  ORF type:complete len:1595 (+),score=334.61 TRINITY_DN8391_c0_g1_i1:117-4901(+)
MPCLPRRPCASTALGILILCILPLFIDAFSVRKPRVINFIASRKSFGLNVAGTELNTIDNVRLRMQDRPGALVSFYEANKPNAPCSASPDGLSLSCVDLNAFNEAGNVEMMLGVGTNTTEWIWFAKVDAAIYANVSTFYIDGNDFVAPISASFTLTGASGASMASITCSVQNSLQLRCIAANGFASAGILSASIFTTGQTPAEFVPISYVNPVVTVATTRYSITASNITMRGYGFGVVGQPATLTLSPAPAAATVVSTRENGRILDFRITTAPSAPGPLFGRVSLNSRDSDDFVQIASIVPDPIITLSTKGISTASLTVTMQGLNFGDSLSELSVALSSGACDPASLSSDGSELICRFTSRPQLGDLTASVSRAGGLPVSALVGIVADPPTVYPNDKNYVDYRVTQFTIYGTNFATRNGTSNSIVFNRSIPCRQVSVNPSGLSLVCQVDDASRLAGVTVLQVTSFEANGIVAEGLSTSPITVALIKVPPTPSPSTKSLLFGATQILHIGGVGFSPVALENSVQVLLSDNTTFIPCPVVSSTETSIECRPDRAWNTHGPVWAQVTSFNLPQEVGIKIANFSGVWTRVGTVRSRPQIVLSTSKVPINPDTITIRGAFFSDDPISSNYVQLFQYGATGTCLIVNATSDLIICQPQLAVQRVGPLSATITVDGIAMAASNVVPVQIAELDTVPVVFYSLKSIPLNATSVNLAGQYFSPSISDNTVDLVDGFDQPVAGRVTFANETLLVYSFTSNIAWGQLIVRSITSHGMINNTRIVVASVRPFPKIYQPDQLDYASGLGVLSTITITGENFSPDPSEIIVELNSGSCKQILLASNDTIVCAVDGLEIEGGLFSARVTILGGVSSLWQPLLRLWPSILTTSTPLPINAPYIIIHGYHFSANLSRLKVGLDRFSACDVAWASTNRINCTLKDPPDVVGPLQAFVTLRRRDSIFNPMISEAVVVASIVPVLERLELPTIAGNSSSLVLHGEGFSSRTLFNRVELSPGDFSCTVTSLTSTAVTCQLPPGKLHGGVLKALLAVYAEDVSQWFYAIDRVDVAVVQPVVVVEPDTVPIVDTIFSFTGFGFSENPEDITVKLSPDGSCVPFAASTTNFNCTLHGTSLGPLYASVTVRNATSTVNYVAIIIIPLPPPAALSPEMLAALNAGPISTMPVDRNAPVDGGVYHVQMVAGSIFGMIIMVLMAIPLIAVIIYIFYLKQREQNSALYRVLLGMAPERLKTADKALVPPAEDRAATTPAATHKQLPSPEEVREKQFGHILKSPQGLKRANSEASDSELSRDDDDDVLPDAMDSDQDADDTESNPDTNNVTSPIRNVDASVDLSFSASTPAPAVPPARKDKEPESPKRVLFTESLPHKRDEDDSDDDESINLAALRPATPRFTFTAIQPDDDDDDDVPSQSSTPQHDDAPVAAAEAEEENFDLPSDDDDEDEREREYLASITKLKQNMPENTAKPVEEQEPAPAPAPTPVVVAVAQPAVAKTVTVVASSASSVKQASLQVPKLAVSTATPLRSAMKRKESVDAPPSDIAKRKVSFMAAGPISVTTEVPKPQSQEQPVARKLSFIEPTPQPSDSSMVTLDEDDIL